MKQIKEFQITGMTLSGFKCYAEPTELDFGNPTVVTGGNGRGKSSIADAIAFVVTGLPFYGERGIDRLYTDGQTEAYVSLRFTDETGTAHELTRSRVKSRMSITYDGYDIRQHDLSEGFGERDVFLSIFNPLYFIEELGDGGKSLLERYLPAISHETVLSGLNEGVREALEDEPLLSPDTYLKRRREEIRDLEQTVIYLTGQKDLAETQSRDGGEKIRALIQRLSALREEESSLEDKRFEALDVPTMREQLIDLSARYDELARDKEDGSDADTRLLALHRALGERRAAVYEAKYTQPIAETAARVKELAAQYQQETARYKSLGAGTVCPTCKRVIGETDLPLMRTAFQDIVVSVVAQGKEQKAQLDELTALERKTEETFRQFQAEDIQKIEAEIKALTPAPNTESADNGAQSLRQEIQALTAELEYGNLTQAEYDRLRSCREEKSACEAELAALQKLSAQPAADYDAKIAQAEQEISEKKKRIADVALYVARRAELTFSQLTMNRVAISLYDVVKSTGEVKDTFRFTYSGRRYDRLSLSEKIRAGMEVSELMKRLTGRNYPIFVDNMESVEDLANVRPTGQIIMAKCVHGAPLSVRAMNAQAQSKAA